MTLKRVNIMKPANLLFRAIHACALAVLLAAYPSNAQVTFTVDPPSVGTGYTGAITLKITGLTNGESVQIGKYADVNKNGAIDDTDPILFGFRIKDGQSAVIGGVTNLNVPIDSDAASGVLSISLNPSLQGFEQRLIGSYLIALSSPTGRFPTQSAPFSVTNAADLQTLSGTVTSSGTPVPYSGVVLFPGTIGNTYPVIGAWADASGHYSIRVPVGSYSALAFHPGFVADTQSAPSHTLAAGDSATDTLTLLSATRAISGKLTDDSNPDAVFAGIGLAVSSTDGLFTFSLTDINGNFSIGVTPGVWGISLDNANNLPELGYLGMSNDYQVDATSGDVTGLVKKMVKSTALIYGKVTDAGKKPIAGIRVSAENQGNDKAVALTDGQGRFTLGVSAGTWQLSVDDNNVAYLFSQTSNLAVSDGQALKQNIAAIQANRQISGYLKDGNNQPLTGIGIWANATINGVFFSAANQTTDSNGHYSLSVADGDWTVGVNTGSSDNTSLGSGYLVPGSQTVTLNNNDATVNFVALIAPYTISGSLRNANNQPISNVGVYAYATINGATLNTGTQTDGNGNFSFSVLAGIWHVGISCSGDNNSLNSQGYECVEEQVLTVASGDVTVTFVATPCSALSVTTTALPDGQSGQYYFYVLSADGCHAPFTWSLTPGSAALPAGLSLSTDGNLTGWPVSSGQSALSFRVTDANGNTADTTLTLAIHPAVLAQPQIAYPARLDATHFQLQVQGNLGLTYRILFSTNLLQSNWATLLTTNPTVMPFWVVDPSATNRQRFYRIEVNN